MLAELGQKLSDLIVKVTPSNCVQFSVVPACPEIPKSNASEAGSLVSLTNCNAKKQANATPILGERGLVEALLNGQGKVFPDELLVNPVKTGSQAIDLVDFGGHFGGEILLSGSSVTASMFSLPKRPRPKEFTRSARKKILDAGGALEKEGYKPEQFGFGTFTLPGSIERAKEMMSVYSREFINGMKQFLRRRKLYLTINTWEWQKRGALHLHLIYVCTDPELMRKLKYLLQEWWFDALDRVSKKSGVNMYARGGFTKSWNRHSKAVRENCCKIIQCEATPGSSPVAYLSKYVGKAAKIPSEKKASKDKDVVGGNNTYYPSSWWSMSKEVCALIQKHSYAWITRLSCNDAMEIFCDMSEDFASIAKLSLNPFSPYGQSDYCYRNIYIKSEDYQEIVDVIGDMMNEFQIKYGKLYVQMEFAQSGKISKTTHLDWLKRCPRAADLMNQFLNEWLDSYEKASEYAHAFFFGGDHMSLSDTVLKKLEKRAREFFTDLAERGYNVYEFISG